MGKITKNITLQLLTLFFLNDLMILNSLGRDPRHEAAAAMDLDLQTETSAERLLKASAGDPNWSVGKSM